MKKMIKTSMLLIMAFCLLCNCFVANGESLFSDVKETAWYYKSVQYVVDKGLMNGVGDGKFSPGGTANRAMLVTLLHRSVGSPVTGATTPFIDLTQDWYKESVAWAHQNGIVNGTGATTFSPSNKITRQDLATILYRYTKNYLAFDVNVTASLEGFPDNGLVSGYAKDAMIWANAEGLVNGELKSGVSYLNPKGNATRAQMAAIFQRFDQYQERKTAENSVPEPVPESQPQYVTVPDFIGLDHETAIGVAKGLGLELVFETGTYDEAFGFNAVISQSVQKDLIVQPGTTITLGLNYNHVILPDFIGMTKAEAAAKAEELGIFMDFAYEVSDEAAGTILKQSIAKDSLVAKYSRLVLVYAVPMDYSDYLTVVSYNMKCACYGKTWAGVIENIKSVDADIIGLQECDDGTNRSSSTPGDFSNQVQQLAHDMGYEYWYFSQTSETSGGKYGHGVISRFPIKESQTITFTAQKDENRNMERHVLDVNGTELIFYNTHLNGSFMDQFNELIAAAEKDYADGKYVLITGDFNIPYENMAGWLDTNHFLPLNGTETFNHGMWINNTKGTKIDNIIISRNIKNYYMDPETGLYVKAVDFEEEDSDHPMLYSHIKLS